MDFWPPVRKTSVPLKLPVNPRTCESLMRLALHSFLSDTSEIERALGDDPVFSTWVFLQADSAGIELVSFEDAAKWFAENPSVLLNQSGLELPAGTIRADVPCEEIASRLALRATTAASVLNSDLESAELLAWQLQLCGILDELNLITTIPDSIAPVLRAMKESEPLSDIRKTMEQSLSVVPGDPVSDHYDRLKKQWIYMFQAGVEDKDSSFESIANLARFIELAELERSFEERLHHEKMLSLKELAYGASHEINNPLANISIRAQALANEEQDDVKLYALKMIHQQAIRANGMISDMMLFAKPPEMTYHRLNVHEILKSALESMRETTELASVQVSLICDESIFVVGSQTHLEEAVMALIQNSVDAIGIGGTVAVTASVFEDAVEIKVADTGTGMSEESLHHMFDPFYSGRDAGRGIGFGLSKCWRIVTLHNGRVTGANVPEGGAIFTIWLPMAAQRSLAG